MNCIDCSSFLEILDQSDHDVICNKCGIINHYICEVVSVKSVNVLLVKTRLTNIFENEFKDLDQKIKDTIMSYAAKIGPHVKSTLINFILLYLEFTNQLMIKYDNLIKKKQRKNIIKILVDINKPNPTIFIRSPITYISFYNYTDKEIEIYHNVSKCLIYLNICNKNNLFQITSKIREILLSIKHQETMVISNVITFVDIIKIIICYELTIDDLTDYFDLLLN